MPPRKRKSPQSDGQTPASSASPPPSLKRSRSSAAPSTVSTTTTTKGKGPVPGSVPAYAAKPPSPECTYERQLTLCQSYRIVPEGFEKCVSCIEKQAILGGCRFVGLRAFKIVGGSNVKKEGEDGKDDKDEREVNFDGAVDGKKKKGTTDKRKGAKPKPTPLENIDTGSDWTFLGTQEKDYVPYSSLDFDSSPSSAPPVPTSAKTVEKPSKTTPYLATRPRRSARGTDSTTTADSTMTADLVPNNVALDTSPGTLLSEARHTLNLIGSHFQSQLQRERLHESVHLQTYSHTVGNPNSELVGTPSSHWTHHPRPIIRIQSSSETRSLCDLCATTIFLGSYLCGCCGREYCLGCWEEWDDSIPDHPLQRGTRQSIANCSRRRYHRRKTIFFTTRAAPEEIASLLTRITKYQTERTAALASNSALSLPPIPSSPAPSLDENLHFLPVSQIPHVELTPERFQSHWQHSRGVPLVVTGLLERFTLPWDPDYFLKNHGHEKCLLNNCGSDNPEADTIEGYVREFFTDFDNANIVIAPRRENSKTIHGSWKLKDWPPADDFAKVFPMLFRDFENALPTACWSYATREGNLNLASKFPKGWNRPDLGPKMYNAYPAVDFLENAPQSQQSERLNGYPTTGVKGTTNLHLDITDAVNILVYASPIPENLVCTNKKLQENIPDEAGAIWDIFPPESAGRIRRYLREEFILPHRNGRKGDGDEKSAIIIDDPIHRQLFYLSEYHLAKLAADKDSVKSYRIYQKPGEAVFIPAGCPHQVRNVRGAVKVAVDFLSAEAVAGCVRLLEEGRALAGKVVNHARVATDTDAMEVVIDEKPTAEADEAVPADVEKKEDKKEKQTKKLEKGLGKREDVLQLWNCLYFAWAQAERAIIRFESAVGAEGGGDDGGESGQGEQEEQGGETKRGKE